MFGNILNIAPAAALSFSVAALTWGVIFLVGEATEEFVNRHKDAEERKGLNGISKFSTIMLVLSVIVPGAIILFPSIITGDRDNFDQQHQALRSMEYADPVSEAYMVEGLFSEREVQNLIVNVDGSKKTLDVAAIPINYNAGSNTVYYYAGCNAEDNIVFRALMWGCRSDRISHIDFSGSGSDIPALAR